ncbi:hypothetical protein DH2020_021666 [Rehmannia glutinosa]|uniref:Vps53 C-terminal domain-containing protein n=1 Tax=Rehmannia glutinosa TaxID=99300 RepID=A0ABR0WB55_REHGL
MKEKVDVFLVFQRILKAYASKLFARLTKGGTGMDGQIKSEELAENVCKIVDPQYADRIDMSEVQDEFSAVITKALVTLVHGIETKFDAEMAAMTRVPWGTLESVGDQSELMYFCNLQMLLDTQAVKTILLDIPNLGKQKSAAAGYSKFVSREMSKAEALLKVILSPVDSVSDTYCALLPEGTPSEFQRILDLKGLKRTEQQSILDDYNKRGAGTYGPNLKPVVPAAPNTSVAPDVASPSSPGIIPLKEEIVARAAALGERCCHNRDPEITIIY